MMPFSMESLKKIMVLHDTDADFRSINVRLKQFRNLAVIVTLMCSGASVAFAQSADPRAGGFTQADRDLLTRQQIRLDTFEESLKELRGQVELEVKNTRTQMEKLSSSVLANSSGASVDAQAIQSELAKLNDSIAILNQRLSRTIEMSSDIEFRVLRLEKRMSTLLQLSDTSISDKIAQDDVVGSGTPADVSLSRDAETGQTVWSIDKSELDAQLDAQDNATTQVEAGTTQEQASQEAALATAETADNQTTETAPLATPAQEQALAQQQPEPDPVPEILPDVSPEEQYRFALGRALQNDLSTAEMAFSEFRQFNEGHDRSSDALFWLGRVQFMLGKFEDSAMTFSEFNTSYADDPRLVETTLWIAESVAQFASAEQACDVYSTLTQLLNQPPESFSKRITELSSDCPQS